ncbi:MAG: Nramp family divalent metal transporter [Candidatus Omnitrophica bacterium]|nr:Nramp family divalent metal transporter [Candidatus Omnitrophota bacterium]
MATEKSGGFLKFLIYATGPALITASVVVGPGSIVTASKAGGHFGYSLVWLLFCSSLFMMAYTYMGSRIGCCADRSILTLTAEKYGRWVSILAGISSFLVVAFFQSGNNLGVATAMTGLTGIDEFYWPIVFTGISLAMLFLSTNLYKLLEILMKVLIGLMVLSFLANLFYTGIRPVAFLKGFIPSFPEGSGDVARGMFPTTFSVVAALYAAHLAQGKKWRREDAGTAGKDAAVGIFMLFFISLIILSTAAGAFYGKEGIELGSAAQLSGALEGLFGSSARYIFCFGLAAAAFSSFLVNAMAGGGLLVDGLGMDKSFDRLPVKIGTTAALLIGMLIAMLALKTEFNPVTTILIAQAATLLAVPVCAVLLLLLANDRSVMGEMKNGPVVNGIAGIGFLVLCWMIWNTIGSIQAKFAALGAGG